MTVKFYDPAGNFTFEKKVEDLCKPKTKPLNVMVVFTQDGEHTHSWEADTTGLETFRMLEAACCSGFDCIVVKASVHYCQDELYVPQIIVLDDSIINFSLAA